MAVWDSPPHHFRNSDWGRVVLYDSRRVVRSYQITCDDVLWLGSASVSEDQEVTFPIWCMLQRFLGLGYESLTLLVAQFSAPVNPLFQFDGSYFRSGRILDPPGAGPDGIPPAVQGNSLGVWNEICTTRGEHRRRQIISGGMLPPARQHKWALMREAKRGSQEAWMALTNGEGRNSNANSGSNKRRALYSICTACWGNPIPGYDNFAAYSATNVNAGWAYLDPGAGNLQTVQAHAGGRYAIRFATGTRVNQETGVATPTGNYYRYRETGGLRGNSRYITVEKDGRSSIDMRVVTHTRAGSVASARMRTLPNNGTLDGLVASNTSGASNIAAVATSVTQEGLAPTEEVPASSSAMSGTSSSSQAGNSDPIPVPPPRPEIMEGLRNWSDNMEIELGQGSGGRRS